MNKRQKAIAQAVPGRVMTASEFEYATDNYKEFRKSRKMNNTQFKEYRETISEGKFSKNLIAKAIKIAKKSSGNMTAAWKAIEKIKKGLGDDPEVANALKLANESKKEDDEENALLDKEALGEIKLKDIVKKEKGSSYTSDTSKTVRKMQKQIKKDKGSDEVVIVKLSDDGDSVMQVPKADFLSKYKKKGYELVEALDEIQTPTRSALKRAYLAGPTKTGKDVAKALKKIKKGTELYIQTRDPKTGRIDNAGEVLSVKGDDVTIRPTAVNRPNKVKAKDISHMDVHKALKRESVEEAMLRDRDWTYDEKEGVVKISKKNFAKVKKDHKGSDKKKPMMMVLTKKGTSLVPVKFTEALEFGTDETCQEYKKKTPGEVDEGLKMNDPKLNKLFDKLKKGSKVKFKISSTIAKGKEFVEYMVTAKNVVNKGKVEKITLVTSGNPKTVKKYLYRRDGKVTFAIGDMGASIDDFQESAFKTFSQYLSEGVYDPKDGEKWAKEIQKGINAPVVQATTSSLGGEERMSIMVKFSMDKEAAKGGTAWHNSRHANLRVDIDGSLEMYMASHKFGIKKMRKAKIKSAKDVIKKINDWIKKVPDLKEEFLAEAYKYKIDHKTYTSAVEEALKVAEKAKYEVDMDDYFNSIATGPRKPGEGKTNTFKIALSKGGKEQRKKLQIQIYGKGKHGYELNCYIA